MSSNGEPFRVRYSKRETGYVEPTDVPGKYKVVNVPVSFGLRWGDIVHLFGTSEDGLIIDEIVERQLEHAAMIFYADLDSWPKIVAAVEARYKRGEDFAMEGGVPPSDGREGFAIINYTDEVDLAHALSGLEGVRFDTEEEATGDGDENGK